MPIVYEYWQHRVTAVIWAVKLEDGMVAGATEIPERDVDESYCPTAEEPGIGGNEALLLRRRCVAAMKLD
jgi:hypothetical protein